MDLTKETGTVIVMDTYAGRNMSGIEKGAIKQLLILEHLPIPVGFSGGMEPLTWGGGSFFSWLWTSATSR